MLRLILLALLCLPLSMSAQYDEQETTFSKNEIGINLNHTDYSGMSGQLVYKRFLNKNNALRFSLGGNSGYIRAYQATLGLRNTLYRKNNFEIQTGFDLVYERITNNVRLYRDTHTYDIDIPLELTYSVKNGLYLTTGFSKGITAYDSIYDEFGPPTRSNFKINFGISKRF